MHVYTRNPVHLTGKIKEKVVLPVNCHFLLNIFTVSSIGVMSSERPTVKEITEKRTEEKSRLFIFFSLENYVKILHCVQKGKEIH